MGFSAQKFLKQFDLFSKPFVFFVGDKKNKSTIIGGFLSFSIIVISIIYFYYLINMYFSNKIEPKITSSITIENEKSNLNIRSNFFIMEMLIQGEPLKRYEKRVGKQFLTYQVLYEQYSSDGSCQQESLPLKECDDPQFDGYLCLDPEIFQQGKNIYSEPINQISADYSIMITPCDPSQTDNCATLEEINSTILQQTNYFQLYTSIKQYNPTKREFVNGYKSEFFYFDTQIIAYTRMSLLQGTTSVIEGMLIQQTVTNDTIFDYKRIDTYFTKEGILDRMGIEGYAYIVFEVNQVHNYIVIQHAMITEILAQFMSIFNSMLTIGIIARLLAESHIVEDMNNILLKEYYKQTALRLVKRQQDKKIMVKINNGKLTTKDRVNQSFSKNKNASHLVTECFDEHEKSHKISELQMKICKTNFAEKSRKYFEIGCWDRIKLCINRIFGKNSNGNLNNDINSDSTIYRNLLKQSFKRINIFEVYKDLIKLKMAIKLILTKEQYAAVHFCGSDISDPDNCQDELLPQKKRKTKGQEIRSVSNSLSLQIPPISIKGKNPNEIYCPSIFAQEALELNSQFSQSSNNNQKNEKNNIFLYRIGENINQISQFNSSLKQTIDCIEETKIENYQKYNSPTQVFLSTINEQQFQQKQPPLQIQEPDTTNTEPITENNKSNSVGKNQIQIEMRDRIQTLNIKGDECITQNSEISIEIQQIIEEGKDKEIQIEGELENLQKNQFVNQPDNLLQTRMHLYDMDQIEEDVESQEKFLKLFLIKMKQAINSNNIENISHIDQQIYSSLLINDHSNVIDYRTQADQILGEIIPSIQINPSLSRQTSKIHNNQNTNTDLFNSKLN